MTVKDLRELVINAPDGMSQEHFDSLPVMISDNDGVFAHASVDHSGHTLSEGTDENGKEISGQNVEFFGVCSKEA